MRIKQIAYLGAFLSGLMVTGACATAEPVGPEDEVDVEAEAGLVLQQRLQGHHKVTDVTLKRAG